MTAVGLALASVYLALDFEVYWVFYAGLAGNLEALEERIDMEAEDEEFEDDLEPMPDDHAAVAEPLGALPPPRSESLENDPC